MNTEGTHLTTSMAVSTENLKPKRPVEFEGNHTCPHVSSGFIAALIEKMTHRCWTPAGPAPDILVPEVRLHPPHPPAHPYYIFKENVLGHRCT